MRLKQFIIDEKLSPEVKYEREFGVTFDDVYQALAKDCKPFLQESGGNVVWRGSGNKYKPTEVQKPRTSRKPRNTYKEIHGLLNRLFNDKFGWKARNGIFGIGGYPSPIYGDAYLFFPIGKFEFLWNPKIEDLWRLPIIQPSGITSMKKYLEEKEKSFKRLVNGYKNTDLKGAIASGNEISFKVSKYYMVKNEQGLAGYLIDKGLIKSI